MDVKGKTKDNEKVRKKLEVYCKRRDLELKPQPNGKLMNETQGNIHSNFRRS